MSNNYVGAGILNIITESLYDNPIVVFREYVQNAVDSIFKEDCKDDYEIKIWFNGNDLCFLDNGRGIDTQDFNDEMVKIGNSSKTKTRNLGYKGIGRLSGVPYCKKLTFINISNYASKELQYYSIDSTKYEHLKITGEDKGLDFTEMMNIIGTSFRQKDIELTTPYEEKINKYKKLLEKTNSGFIVVLEDISTVLRAIIESDDFFQNLQWLLPVDFEQELYSSESGELFKEFTTENCNNLPILSYCRISFNDDPIYRPIKKNMLRDYLCKNNFKYALGFHSFNRSKIVIDRKNIFTGIRIYIDNMLLCTEDELLRSLDNYGLLTHTLNGQLQSVRGIGAIIYITDKVNISANARRTFIEVTDTDSIEFLKLIAEFVNTIYDTRYALSYYMNAKEKHEQNTELVMKLKENALVHLKKLAKENIELPDDDSEITSFETLNVPEKKRMIKKNISQSIDIKLKSYLLQLNVFDLENSYEKFIEWLKNN